MKLTSMLLEGGTSISEARTIVEVIQRDRLHFMIVTTPLLGLFRTMTTKFLGSK